MNGYMKQAIASISIEKPLLEEARKVAKARRQSLSSYLCTLIELDVLKSEYKSDKSRKLAAA
jgi:hypothetical protein